MEFKKFQENFLKFKKIPSKALCDTYIQLSEPTKSENI